MPDHSVRISGDPWQPRVEVDGHDISNGVRSVTIRFQRDHRAEVSIELRADTVEVGSLDHPEAETVQVAAARRRRRPGGARLDSAQHVRRGLPMSDPDDPITQLAASAVGAHELFTAYVGAGFTDNQALYLVGQIITAAVRGPGA